VRGSSEWLQREVQVCAWLESVDALSVRPATCLPAGPHECGGIALTFWEYVEVQEARVSPKAAGVSLRLLHSALDGCPVTLPAMVPIDETWRLLQRPVIRSALTADDTKLLVRTAERARSALQRYEFAARPLHGDAHYGNLWTTGRGLVWGDFEDTHAGPVEWDLACLVTSSIVFGSGRAAREAIRAYGRPYDEALLELLVTVRTLQAVGWALVATPSASVSQRLSKRLEWLRARL
jgi:thiamine kinase-like enzyme